MEAERRSCDGAGRHEAATFGLRHAPQLDSGFSVEMILQAVCTSTKKDAQRWAGEGAQLPRVHIAALRAQRLTGKDGSSSNAGVMTP